MLRSIRELQGYGIEATDGLIGRIHEMLFHDDRWAIRYLVVDTGEWLPGRKVLISPISVETISAGVGRVALHLDREQIRHSPDISVEEPVSRQKRPSSMRITDMVRTGPDQASGVRPCIDVSSARSLTRHGRRPKNGRRRGIFICGAHVRSSAITSQPRTETSGIWTTSSSTTHCGRCGTSS